MHRAATPPTATPAVMHVARDQDVAKIEDAWHTRTQGGVQMPACPLESLARARIFFQGHCRFYFYFSLAPATIFQNFAKAVAV